MVPLLSRGFGLLTIASALVIPFNVFIADHPQSLRSKEKKFDVELLAGGRYVRSWDAETANDLLVLQGHIENAEWSPDGSQNFIPSFDQTQSI